METHQLSKTIGYARAQNKFKQGSFYKNRSERLHKQIPQCKQCFESKQGQDGVCDQSVSLEKFCQWILSVTCTLTLRAEQSFLDLT